ncbi:MAG: hypothetical protein M3Y51_10890 [Actinomycetota bacterium]|nr:hypothetical protein [Actinomycetota bacterium]
MQLLSWSWSPVVGHILADAPLFAHQGGWDEMLMVAVPVAAFAALLYGANRRASHLGDGSDPGAPTDGTDGGDGGSGPSRPRAPEPRNERGGPI